MINCFNLEVNKLPKYIVASVTLCLRIFNKRINSLSLIFIENPMYQNTRR